MKRQRGMAIAFVYLIGVAVVLAALAGIAYKIHHDGYEEGKGEIQAAWDAANEKRRKAEADQAAAASTQVEVKSEKAKVVYRTITQSVDRIIDRPVYRNICLDDDGLRNANAALLGQSPATGEPDKPVPAPKSTTGRDRGRSVAEADRSQ